MSKPIYLFCCILCLLVRTQSDQIESYAMEVIVEATNWGLFAISFYNFLITKGEK